LKIVDTTRTTAKIKRFTIDVDTQCLPSCFFPQAGGTNHHIFDFLQIKFGVFKKKGDTSFATEAILLALIIGARGCHWVNLEPDKGASTGGA